MNARILSSFFAIGQEEQHGAYSFMELTWILYKKQEQAENLIQFTGEYTTQMEILIEGTFFERLTQEIRRLTSGIRADTGSIGRDSAP
jgi:hypothetical protein